MTRHRVERVPHGNRWRVVDTAAPWSGACRDGVVAWWDSEAAARRHAAALDEPSDDKGPGFVVLEGRRHPGRSRH